MQKTLAFTAIAALMGVAGAANAADIYSGGGFKDGLTGLYPAWSGFYGGLNAGGAWSNLDVTDEANNYQHFSNSSSGFFGGGQFGYLVQLGNLVAGPEIDLGELSLSHTAGEAGAPTVTTSTVGSGFYFDITGRLGYTYGPALFYAKGGYAQFDGRLAVNDTVSSKSFSERTGWTVGGGVEYQITPAWSVKGEYQYFDFGEQGAQFTLGDTNVYDYGFTVNTFKVGLNYHLGGCCAAAPLK